MITWPTIDIATLSADTNGAILDILMGVRVTALDGSTLAPTVAGAKALLSHAVGAFADFPMAVEVGHFTAA